MNSFHNFNTDEEDGFIYIDDKRGDIVIAKYNTQDGSFVWVDYFGNDDSIEDPTVIRAFDNKLFIAGAFTSFANFNPNKLPPVHRKSKGNYDILLGSYNLLK